MTNINLAHAGNAGKSALGAKTKGLRFIPVSRNLLNWPIARHGRTKLEWERGKHSARCALNKGVTLELSNKCKVQRCPSAFDVLVLLTLTALARRKGYALAVTNIEILEAMGVRTYRANQQRLSDALELWDHLTLHFLDWYWPARDKRSGMNVSESFKPLMVIGEGSRRRIVMEAGWVRATSRYFQGIPTPLPTQVSVLNLVCLVFGADGKGKDRKGYKIKRFKSQRWLTRRLGLNSTSKNTELLDAMAGAEIWFGSKVGYAGLEWDLVWDFLPSGEIEVRYSTQATKNLKREATKKASRKVNG